MATIEVQIVQLTDYGRFIGLLVICVANGPPFKQRNDDIGGMGRDSKIQPKQLIS